MIMNRTSCNNMHLALCIAAFLSSANAWTQVSPSLPMLQKGYNEKYAVFTDRSLYIAGEDLYFSAFNCSEEKIQSVCRSKVYYVELVKADGDVVAEGKFPMTPEGTEGCISIPEKTSAGIYFLRSYTRWMRNFSPAGYAYNRLKIINPALMESGNPVADTSGYSCSFIPEDSTVNKAIPIRCSTDKISYGVREKAVLSVEIPAVNKSILKRYCITIARPGAVSESRKVIFTGNNEEAGDQYAVRYLPESEGLTVTGAVLIKKTAEPAKNALVQLAILDEKGDYLSYYTGKDGKFFFSLLPLAGRQDLFILARNAADDELEIRVDKDYANHNTAFGTGPFTLDPQERSLALEMMVDAQVKKAYSEKAGPVSLPVKPDSSLRCFYGKPLKTVYIDDFIALPTLEEVFFELVPEIHISKRKEITSMVLNGNPRNSADLASYNPLILLDRIPVYNLKDLLEISPAKIQRIEIINDVYIKGSVIYGGVVSIFSRKGDLAGIKLPRNSYFFDYSGYYPKPDGSAGISDSLSSKRIPDFRNCLYWNPEVFIKPGEKTSLEFYTSDNRGEFEVVVNGLTAEGEIIEKRCRFRVD
jgi:hypothetical protein